MLTCRDLSELASELLEGRALWTDRLAARAHLFVCRFCREYLKQLQLTIATVHSIRPPEPPVDLEKVVQEIERANRR